MPPHLVDAAARRARDRGHDGGWAFTLHTHSFQALMRHHSDRADRERLYRLWQRRDRGMGLAHASPDGIIERLAALRAERAALLGRGSHFEQSLAASAMVDAGRLETVLRSLVPVARQLARDELRRMRQLARGDGVSGPLRPWDVFYYRQRLREACPGEPLDRNLDAATVRAALFATVGALWDLRLRPAPEVASWHPEASAWRVADAEGRSLGLLYLDLFYRPGKAGGAWTSVYATPGETDEPIVAVATNFDRAGGLDLEDVRALFHEFGHALHSLLSEAAYPALAPSNLPPDFGEFPAILLERLATHPEVFRRYGNGAADARGGIEARLHHARCRERAVAGLDAMQLIAAIELERLLHGASDRQAIDLESAERRVRERLELPPPLSPRHHGSGLAGLFAAPRHGGDFATLWAEILAADAFSALDAGDSIDRDRAEVFREEILSGSGARAVEDAWIAFMGRAPLPDGWIDARGPAIESSYESKIPSGE
jgi:peptidyl-dipeptidase Dcp